jgi:hypothetical protein
MIDEIIYGLVGLAAYKLAAKKAPKTDDAGSPPPADSPPISSMPPSVVSGAGVAGAFAGADSGSGDKVEAGARKAATPERVARIKAAWQGREIPGLNHIALALFIGQRESGSNYRPLNNTAKSRGYPLGMNQSGFVGMYQVGAAGLEEAGFIKPGMSKKGNRACLMDLSNWTSMCPGGLEQFLNTPELQELAFAKFTNRNKIYIRSILSPTTSPQDTGGYLAAAHLTGHTGAKALASGKTRKDANGASNAEYYRIGAKSQSV